MHRKGVPVFPTPERAINSFAHLVSADKKAKAAAHTLPSASGRTRLSLYQSLTFLESEGFPCIVSRMAESQGKAVHVAHQLGFPVSLKVDSPDILHKSDFGGVSLNLQSAQNVRQAYIRMMDQIMATHPQAKINGAVISAMASPGLELILGMNRDPQFGPVIIFGLGGITVELFRDVSMRLLPFTREDALSMINEIKGAPLLKGFRGSRPIDEDSVVEGLLELSQIAQKYPDIVEIDLNPVFAYPDGMVVVDARVLKG